MPMCAVGRRIVMRCVKRKVCARGGLTSGTAKMATEEARYRVSKYAMHTIRLQVYS